MESSSLEMLEVADCFTFSYFVVGTRCVLVIAMLDSIPLIMFPGIPPSVRFRSTDIAMWKDFWAPLEKEVNDGCVVRQHLPGFMPVGEQLILSNMNSFNHTSMFFNESRKAVVIFHKSSFILRST